MATKDGAIGVNTQVQKVEFDAQNVNRFQHPVRMVIAGKKQFIF